MDEAANGAPDPFLDFFLNMEAVAEKGEWGSYFDLALATTMAENYSKGTRVWFPDKEQGWLSAEVQGVAKGSKDGVKISFVDERGKVWSYGYSYSSLHSQSHRKSWLTRATTMPSFRL